eukprot:Rmarinus@m.9030
MQCSPPTTRAPEEWHMRGRARPHGDSSAGVGTGLAILQNPRNRSAQTARIPVRRSNAAFTSRRWHRCPSCWQQQQPAARRRRGQRGRHPSQHQQQRGQRRGQRHQHPSQHHRQRGHHPSTKRPGPSCQREPQQPGPSCHHQRGQRHHLQWPYQPPRGHGRRRGPPSPPRGIAGRGCRGGGEPHGQGASTLVPLPSLAVSPLVLS